MKRCSWKSLFTGACVLLASSCTQSNKKAESNVGSDYREGQILVRTNNIDAVLAESSDLKATPVWHEIGIYKIQSSSLAGEEQEFADKLIAKHLVESAEPNYIVRVSALPDKTTDPMWLDMWGLNNIGQDAPNGTEGKEGADIGVLKSWNAGNEGSNDVLVAVMDTGIDYLHEDLKKNIYINKAELTGLEKKDDDADAEKICVDEAKKICYTDDVYGWNFVSMNDTQTYEGVLGSPNPMDGNGHGTHVAGTIGAEVNNAKGVAGINKNVKMIALKVLDDNGSGSTDDIIRAIRYAAKKKVHVVNASFGGGGKSQNFLYALAEAGKAGVLFVAAAGNESNDNDAAESFPSSYDLDTILSVAATDNRDQLAEFSNYGFNKVDIAAPGVNIASTYPRKLTANEEGVPEGQEANPYRVFSGTSMATPHVVGAAALLMGSRPELRGNPSELKRVLMESADRLPQLAGRVRSGGRLNVDRAIRNDLNKLLEEKTWEEQDYAWSSPNMPTGHIDVLKTIKIEGAKAIQARIKSSLMDSIDLAALYDGSLRMVSFIPGDLQLMLDQKQEYWTPVVDGDSLTLRFANALVSVTKVKQQHKGITEEEAGELSGDIMCFPSPIPGKVDCTEWADPSDPFANFRSEGFSVDKIRVLK